MLLRKKLILFFIFISIIITVSNIIISKLFIENFIKNNYIKSKIILSEHLAKHFTQSIIEDDILMGLNELNVICEDSEIMYIIVRNFDKENFIDYHSKNIDNNSKDFLSNVIMKDNGEIDEYNIVNGNTLHLCVAIIEGLDARVYIGYNIRSINVLYDQLLWLFIIFGILCVIIFIFFINKILLHFLSPLTLLSECMSLYGENKLIPDTIEIHSNSTEIEALINTFENMIKDRDSLKSEIIHEKNLIQTLINKTSMEISLWDNELYLIDLNNESLKNFKDIEKDNIIGKHISEIIPGFGKTERYNKYLAVIKTGKPYFEQTSFEHNGKLRYVNIEAFYIEDGLGVIITDLTESKEQQEKLQQIDKMRSLGELAGGIAHDFNNQLAGIMGGADLIMMHTNDESTKENAELIMKASEKSADLINQLLAFARKGQYQLKAISMHHIINEVIKILERSINKKIRIKTILKAKLDIVKCDETQIENMILNLCFNARDSIDKHGEISIVTDITELDDDYCNKLIYVIEPGKYFTISITDTGIGMDKETVNKIFEPFYTTKPKGKGTGMGLASVYGTIKNHKGAINVYSEKGHGSTFRVYLPLSSDSDISVEEKTNDHDFSVLKDKCILMIDDEKMILDVTEKILTNIGIKPILFENGKDAIKYYKQNYKKIDIVFIDMIMPDISGSELFDELILINPQMKAVVLSGYSLNGTAEDIMNKGAISFLQKPYTLSKLKETLFNILKN